MFFVLLLCVVVGVAAHANANVKRVVVKYLQDDTFLFDVAIDHDDDGEHFCDGWSVYSDNTAMTLYTSATGSREGMTVHFAAPLETETSQGTVVIPKNVERVVVRAHDKQQRVVRQRLGNRRFEVGIRMRCEQRQQKSSVQSTQSRTDKIAIIIVQVSLL
jgi:hypothetical protein